MEARIVLLRVELHDINDAICILNNRNFEFRYSIKVLKKRADQIMKEIYHEKQR